MDDWISVVMATVVAPALSGLFAYMVTRRRERAEAGKTAAEANGTYADTAGKYRAMLNAEIEERHKVQDKCNELEDAFRQAIEENDQLRAENRILRDQVRAAGLPDLLRRPEKPTRRTSE